VGRRQKDVGSDGGGADGGPWFQHGKSLDIATDCSVPVLLLPSPPPVTQGAAGQRGGFSPSIVVPCQIFRTHIIHSLQHGRRASRKKGHLDDEVSLVNFLIVSDADR
jgi:hypothetical protein